MAPYTTIKSPLECGIVERVVINLHLHVLYWLMLLPLQKREIGDLM